ncbi:MAG: cation diffusion facilitator family transporter [Candidatus Obscuribacterales bacterium]
MTGAKPCSLAFFRNPFFVMGLVLFMYAVKAAVKITLGSSINSPMIEGDGFHNLADILEALAVMAVIYVSKLPSSDEYPFGRKNIEFFASLAIGIGLLALSLQFASRSIGGMLFYFPTLDQAVRSVLPLPAHEPLVMDPGTFPVVLGISLVSVVLSVVVSRYQIAVGRSSGHASLVADGEETASDSRIEFVTLGGILAEYAFDAPYLEYPLGLLVAFLIARTGWELFSRAWKVLLQHSLGAERETEIRKLCLMVPGVVDLASLKTFQVGQTAVVMVTVVTRRGSGPTAFMKYGLEHIVQSYLLGDEFKECELSVKFQKPSPERYRVAYAVSMGESHQVTVAASLRGASHLVICDV